MSGGDGSLGLAFRFARRELRGGLRGFWIFLACLALGVASIAAVGTVTDSVRAGLARDGRILLGGDLDLRLQYRTIDDAERGFLTARGSLSAVAETRAMARASDAAGKRSLIELRAIDSAYPLYGAVGLTPAMPLAAAVARRDGVWGAVADANLLYRLGLEAPGTTAGESGPPRVRIGEAVYEIRAVLSHEPDRTTQVMAFGPHVLVAAQSLPETGLVQPGSLLHYHYRLRLPVGGDPAALRRELERVFPNAAWRIRDASQAAPGVERFVERLGLFLTLVGLTALLVGGLGVANAVRSYLDGRIKTIATLKCLGGSGSLILRVYLVQIMVLALGGTVFGVALGAVAPFALRALLTSTLGFKVLAGVYAKPLLIATAFGLLTALGFSLWPLAQARRVPAAALFRARIAPLAQSAGGIGWPSLAAIGLVSLALAGLTVLTAAEQRFGLYFVLGAITALLLFRMTALGLMALARRVPRPRRAVLRLALTNLHRPGATTPSVLLSLGLGLTVLVALAQIQANLERQIGERLPREAPGFYFIDIQPDQVAPFEALVLGTPGVRDLERVPMLRGRITAVRGVPVEELEIPPDIGWVFRGDRGLTWSRNAPEGAELTAGTWWPPDYAGRPLVSLDAAVGAALGLGPGDSLTLNILGRSVAVEIANLREIDWTGLGINFVMVLSPGLLEGAPQSHIATVKADPAVEDALERKITDRFANVSSIRVKEALAAVAAILAQIGLAVRLSASVAILAGVLVLAGAIAAGHRRRVYDAVVLKVLGATRGELARAFLLEYGLLGLVTALLAAVFGTLAAYLVLTGVMHAPFTLLPGVSAATAALAAVITLAFGFVGTWRALGHKAAPLLRNE